MKDNKLNFYLQLLVTLAGGYMGTYALLNFNTMFASAQTTNIINIIFSLLGGNIFELLERLIAIIIFFLGVVSTVILPRYFKTDLRIISLMISFAAIIVISILPKNTEHFTSIYPIVLATSFQWCTFKGVDGYATSSIFSTNNLKQFTLSIAEYYYDRDEEKLHKAKIYGSVVVFFLIGTALSYEAYMYFDKYGIIGCTIPLLFSLVMVLFLVRKPKEASELTNMLQ